MAELVLCWRCLEDTHSFAHGFQGCVVEWNFLRLDLLGGKHRSLSLSLPENWKCCQSLNNHSNHLVNSSVTVTLSGLVAKEEESLLAYETCWGSKKLGIETPTFKIRIACFLIIYLIYLSSLTLWWRPVSSEKNLFLTNSSSLDWFSVN